MAENATHFGRHGSGNMAGAGNRTDGYEAKPQNLECARAICQRPRDGCALLRSSCQADAAIAGGGRATSSIRRRPARSCCDGVVVWSRLCGPAHRQRRAFRSLAPDRRLPHLALGLQGAGDQFEQRPFGCGADQRLRSVLSRSPTGPVAPGGQSLGDDPQRGQPGLGACDSRPCPSRGLRPATQKKRGSAPALLFRSAHICAPGQRNRRLLASEPVRELCTPTEG